jgi:hypothetical protein
MHCRTSTFRAVGRGGQATSSSPTGRAVDAVQLRHPSDRCVYGPVATRDAHLPLPRRQDGAQSGGHRVFWEDSYVLARRWDLSTSPRRGRTTFLLGLRTFLGMIARLSRSCLSPTPTVPPGLGSSSSTYMFLTLILNVCMHFKRM